MSRTVLITGGCGFVGHHFVEHFILHTDWNIVVLDKLNYSGTLDRLRDIGRFDEKRILVLTADICELNHDGILRELSAVTDVYHLAAESHVENSISDPIPFVQSNVAGTVHLMQACMRLPKFERFYYFSTDEVFGPAPEGVEYREDDVHNPTNPYSASKSAGEMFVKAFRNTYNFPAIITRTMNVFGERQHPEKFVPLVIRSVLNGDTVPIHSDGQKAGSRFWIHARNVADAYLFLDKMTEDCHIVGSQEVDNLTLAQFVALTVGEPLEYEMVHFSESRPGHDLRYALSGERLARAGWKPPVDIWESLEKTVLWYLDNRKWLDV